MQVLPTDLVQERGHALEVGQRGYQGEEGRCQGPQLGNAEGHGGAGVSAACSFRCPPTSDAPLTVTLPEHICLLLLAHTCRKHSRVPPVHRVCDLVREQVRCGERRGRGQGQLAPPPPPPAPPPARPNAPPGLLCT